jgi:hypothetical protein
MAAPSSLASAIPCEAARRLRTRLHHNYWVRVQYLSSRNFLLRPLLTCGQYHGSTLSLLYESSMDGPLGR